jgi:hypothetical protein
MENTDLESPKTNIEELAYDWSKRATIAVGRWVDSAKSATTILQKVQQTTTDSLFVPKHVASILGAAIKESHDALGVLRGSQGALAKRDRAIEKLFPSATFGSMDKVTERISDLETKVTAEPKSLLERFRFVREFHPKRIEAAFTPAKSEPPTDAPGAGDSKASSPPSPTKRGGEKALFIPSPTKDSSARVPDVEWVEGKIGPAVSSKRPRPDSGSGRKRVEPDRPLSTVTDLNAWKEARSGRTFGFPSGREPGRRSLPSPPSALVNGAIHYGVPAAVSKAAWGATDFVLEGGFKEISSFRTVRDLSEKMSRASVSILKEYGALHAAGTVVDASVGGGYSLATRLLPGLPSLGPAGLHGNALGRTTNLFLVLSAIQAAHGGHPWKDAPTVLSSVGQIMALQESATVVSKFIKLSPAARSAALSGRMPLIGLARAVSAVQLSQPASIAIGAVVFYGLEGVGRGLEYFLVTRPTKEALVTELAQASEALQEALLTNEVVTQHTLESEEWNAVYGRWIQAINGYYLYDEHKLYAERHAQMEALAAQHLTDDEERQARDGIEAAHTKRMTALLVKEQNRQKPLPETIPLSLILPIEGIDADVCRSGRCVETFTEQLAHYHPTSAQLPEFTAKLSEAILHPVNRYWENRGVSLQPTADRLQPSATY